MIRAVADSGRGWSRNFGLNGERDKMLEKNDILGGSKTALRALRKGGAKTKIKG